MSCTCLLLAVIQSSIPEVSPTKEKDSISEMCQQLTQGLSALTEASPAAAGAAAAHDPFSAAPLGGQAASSNTPQSTAPTVPSHHPTPIQGTPSAGSLNT